MSRQSQRRIGIWLACGVVLAWACIAPAAALADGSSEKAGKSANKGDFEIEVIVANLSQKTGGIDEGAARLHKELQNQFRYEGIHVLESESVRLAADRVWDMKLPTRRRLRIRPLVVEEKSALISVEVSGLVESDLRIKKGQLIVIGAERFRDGKLVIALEAQD